MRLAREYRNSNPATEFFQRAAGRTWRRERQFQFRNRNRDFRDSNFAHGEDVGSTVLSNSGSGSNASSACNTHCRGGAAPLSRPFSMEGNS
jgi:hypothetical protein